jgi:dTDP-L-rhamnose 4-epimerase
MRIFAISLFFGKEPIIFEDGQQVRDFVNIKDVVAANRLVLEQSKADGNIFNVGGGKAWTVSEFYHTMQKIVGRKKDPILSGYYRYGDTRHIVSDIRKLKSLGWKPTYGVEDSIQSYWEYINEQEDLENILEYAEKHMEKLRVIRKIR